MSSHDDADPDDEALSGLRSVWLSMPDEEPPQRGLAELMAAARVKADEMAEVHAKEEQPSLWQRFLATLRRPQVLALATIVILIGGGLFIGTRHDKLEAPAPTVTAPESVAPTTPSASSAAGSAAPVQTQTAAPEEAAKAADSAEPVRDEKPKQDMKREASPKKIAPHSTNTGKAKSAGQFKPMDQAEFDLETGGAVTTEAVPQAVPEPAGPSASDLHQQALAAAGRGDCATVKTLAKQIARVDAAYYRAHIAPDQALATCLN